MVHVYVLVCVWKKGATLTCVCVSECALVCVCVCVCVCVWLEGGQELLGHDLETQTPTTPPPHRTAPPYAAAFAFNLLL